MRWNAVMLLFGLSAFWAGHVGAANQVVVESKTVLPGAVGVVIGVRVTNDVPLTAFVVPLKIREVTWGAFIRRLALSWGGRADSVLNDCVYNLQYSFENYYCGAGGRGFHDIVSWAADSSRKVGNSPVGLLFVRLSIQSPLLPAGTDTDPSMRLVVNVTWNPGTFEVDTTCTATANHLQFMWDSNEGQPTGATPSFTKGVITIAPCSCPHQGDLNGDGIINVTDVLRVSQIAFNNGTDVQDPTCPRTRADVNNTGVVNVNDVVYIQNYVFNNGPGPVNPCGP